MQKYSTSCFKKRSYAFHCILYYFIQCVWSIPMLSLHKHKITGFFLSISVLSPLNYTKTMTTNYLRCNFPRSLQNEVKIFIFFYDLMTRVEAQKRQTRSSEVRLPFHVFQAVSGKGEFKLEPIEWIAFEMAKRKITKALSRKLPKRLLAEPNCSRSMSVSESLSNN